VAGLDTALMGAKRESDALRAQVAASGSDPALRARLEAAQLRQARLLSAARMDYSAVSDASGKAVVLIAVEMPDGRAFSGSGFAVSSKGVVVTNRHLLRDETGAMAKRVAVIFSDTRDWLPARIVSVSDNADIGVLQIEGNGTYPQVVGVEPSAAAIKVGSPVAIIGYPLGTETPMEGNGNGLKITARSTLGAGTISKTLKDVLQVDAYAGQGSSGSPVFDARGIVIGVVYGGATESNGRIVYAVPAERVIAEIQKAK
jgi:serine protease Do